MVITPPRLREGEMRQRRSQTSVCLRLGAESFFLGAFLLFRCRTFVEGFRAVTAPIQPVFSLSASWEEYNLSSIQRKAKQEQQPTFVDFSGGTLEFSWHASIANIPARVWDECLPNPNEVNQTTGRSPFLEHSWLHCLETSGCVSEATGWIPHHLSIHIHTKTNIGTKIQSFKNARTIETVLMDGCVPVYIKTHSMGEFIFDDTWADAAFRNGLDYYPKLLIGVPFSPVKGPRILWHSHVWESVSLQEMGELNRAVGKFLKQSATARGWSSVHINFCTDQEAAALTNPLDPSGDCNVQLDEDGSSLATEVEGVNTSRDGILESLKTMAVRQIAQNDTNLYLRRTSIQYQWRNRNPQRRGRPFASFEEYLSCFRSKRRITIRRERTKARQDGNLRIDAVSGADIVKIDGLVERMFEIYMSTVNKMFRGRQYLTLEFFQVLFQTSFVNNICFLCVRNQTKDGPVHGSTTGKSATWKAEDVFAGTFNVVKDGVFYGRYWGCLPGHEVKNLHFETCYWSAIDYCIEKGLKRMEPGAGGADYKWARGFDPKLIHSVHYICNPILRQAVSQFVASETEYNVALKKHLMDKSALAERA